MFCESWRVFNSLTKTVVEELQAMASIPPEEWEALQQEIDQSKFAIGDKLTDEHGNIGFVGIKWNDGDFCTIVNDAAHADPRKI